MNGRRAGIVPSLAVKHPKRPSKDVAERELVANDAVGAIDGVAAGRDEVKAGRVGRVVDRDGLFARSESGAAGAGPIEGAHVVSARETLTGADRVGDEDGARDAGGDLRARLEKMSDEMLANPVIEEFEIKL